MDRIAEFRGECFFLSNFFPCTLAGARGLEYPSAEHAFQGGKTRDPVQRARIAAAPTAGAAKRLGKRVELVRGWDEYRHVVMRAVLRTKFADPELAQRLLATGDAELVEGNRWCDQEWGSCCCPRHRDIPGQNWLGRYLMQRRGELARSKDLA